VTAQEAGARERNDPGSAAGQGRHGEPAVDCHVHVIDPARFPYAADTAYRPLPCETGSVDQLGHLLDAHGVRHALIVGPNSGYGPDNRCMLDALARGAGRYRGVAVVRDDASRGELQDLRAAGVVGAAFNVALSGVEAMRASAPLLERLRDLGLWAQVQCEADQLAELDAMLRDCGARLLFDHCGRPVPERGLGQPGFRALLALAGTGRAVVKLSGYAKFSARPFPHDDVRPFVRALLEAFTPQSLVWASDWPFLRAPARIDYGPLAALLRDLLPDPAARRAVLWDTPTRLFGFDAAAAGDDGPGPAPG
jgi:predicted TIM-barrel fold metal-dependent hydrolase